MKLYKYALLRYVDNQPMDGDTKLNIISIKNSSKGSENLLIHELTHVRQFYKMFGISLFVAFVIAAPVLNLTLGYILGVLSLATDALCYKFIRKYREKCEVRAYQNQINYLKTSTGQPVDISFAVNALVNDYKLSITKEQAVQALGE
jgi:hypothetical protein